VYKLVFGDDTEYAGLEMAMRSVTIGEMARFRGMGSSESEAEAQEKLCTLISSRLISWNREEEDGTPVPATREGLDGEEVDFLYVVIDKWNHAIRGVAAPLESGSPDGEITPEASIPTEALSSSLAS
jgi:hypothetical protein